MDCVFCSICRGQEDAVILDETDQTLAFAPLDHVSEGHMLVIPKEHHESLLDIPEPTLCAVMRHVRTLSCRLCADEFDGVNLLNASGRAAHQSVQHFHVHLAPRRAGDQLDLWPESSYDETETELIYEAVRRALTTSDGQ
jgi:histidine triad (HIT) family protein